MRLDDERESDNIDDRRGDPSFGGGGGNFGFGAMPFRGSLGTMVVIGVVLWFLGVSPTTILGLLLGQQSGDAGPAPREIARSGPISAGTSHDQMTQFIRKVLATTEDAWTEIFRREGKSYTKPTLVLFTGATRAAGCGLAQSAAGPFYCPTDQKVYIDLAFYEELRQRFDAPGDFAEAYVIAHEVGHHVQNLIGVLPRFNEARQRMSAKQANALSVRVELQADCFAGVWGRFVADRGRLDPGDLDQALNAATRIGDDAIQKQTQGYVVPDSFTHGSGAQRKAWFQIGYNKADMNACDTFRNATP